MSRRKVSYVWINNKLSLCWNIIRWNQVWFISWQKRAILIYCRLKRVNLRLEYGSKDYERRWKKGILNPIQISLWRIRNKKCYSTKIRFSFRFRSFKHSRCWTRWKRIKIKISRIRKQRHRWRIKLMMLIHFI